MRVYVAMLAMCLYVAGYADMPAALNARVKLEKPGKYEYMY